MKKKYHKVAFFLFFFLSIFFSTFSQTCAGLTATYNVFESRCAATGRIVVTASGGSGIYNYRVTGPVVTPYSSSNNITGLPAGSYQVIVKDVSNNCTKPAETVVVPGSYSDPRFQLTTTDVTCTNGLDGSIAVSNMQYGRSPFTFTIIAPSASAVGTSNSTGVFTGLSYGSYLIQLRDSCGGIQTRLAKIRNYTWAFQSTTVTKFTCDSATVTMVLTDMNGVSNTSGTGFNSFVYGICVTPGDTTWSASATFKFLLDNYRSATLIAKDNCGTIKTVIWNVPNKPSVSGAVNISNLACSTFTASVGGQANLTNPEYCLYDNSNALVGCNFTGQFNNLPYGSYCINVRDLCYDTTIVRCFTRLKPIPSVNANVQISYPTCTGYVASITGQTNLFDANYCLYDANDVLLNCNSTGVFPGIAFGSYCIKISGGACYDTTIIRCVSLGAPIYSVGANPLVSNKTCTDFSVTVQGQSNFSNADYCIYNNANTLVSCNTTGVFNNLPFGTYCIDVSVTTAQGACYDTTIRRCITVAKNISSVNATVVTNLQNCTSFFAQITGQTNLSNPKYYLYSGSTALDSNTTGVFDYLAFGSYCISIVDGCDTTIQRCFSYSAPQPYMNTSMQLSCFIGHTRLAANFTSGFGPYRVEIFDHLNNLVRTVNSASTNIVVDSLPNLPSGNQYRLVGYDVCNRFDEDFDAPNASTWVKTLDITGNCPGGLQPNGSADMVINSSSNLGTVEPAIIKKNGAGIYIANSYRFGDRYEFYDLDPATYIVRYNFYNGCSFKYDTIVVAPYSYPSLDNSNAYQCDNSDFSVGAAVTGGLSPYTYEIIGSTPSAPSILAGPQLSPVFNISTGTTYSLVRLRTVDGCGNASLNDVSVLPLANIIVNASSDCYYTDVTLSVDTIATATYTWYKRVGATDSVIVGNDVAYEIKNLLPTDTGRYVCKVSVNNGCLIRISEFTLVGVCGNSLLRGEGLSLNGRYQNNSVELQWIMKNETAMKEYAIERLDKQSNVYTTIGKISANNRNVSLSNYLFIDNSADEGMNYYRIRALSQNGKSMLSNVIAIRTGNSASITVFPNPVLSSLTINFGTAAIHSHHIKLRDISGKLVFEKVLRNSTEQNYVYRRESLLEPGTYILQVIDLNNFEVRSQRIVFK
jgi:hypothetical protein